jgi:hypothetical protein
VIKSTIADLVDAVVGPVAPWCGLRAGPRQRARASIAVSQERAMPAE